MTGTMTTQLRLYSSPTNFPVGNIVLKYLAMFGSNIKQGQLHWSTCLRIIRFQSRHKNSWFLSYYLLLTKTMLKDHVYRMVKDMVQQYLTKPNHCIWPIRTHYTFVSTNEQFAPNEDDLAMVQRPSTITILYIWSLSEGETELQKQVWNANTQSLWGGYWRCKDKNCHQQLVNKLSEHKLFCSYEPTLFNLLPAQKQCL